MFAALTLADEEILALAIKVVFALKYATLAPASTPLLLYCS